MRQVVPLFVLSHCNAAPRPLSYRAVELNGDWRRPLSGLARSIAG